MNVPLVKKLEIEKTKTTFDISVFKSCIHTRWIKKLIIIININALKCTFMGQNRQNI